MPNHLVTDNMSQYSSSLKKRVPSVLTIPNFAVAWQFSFATVAKQNICNSAYYHSWYTVIVPNGYTVKRMAVESCSFSDLPCFFQICDTPVILFFNQGMPKSFLLQYMHAQIQ